MNVKRLLPLAALAVAWCIACAPAQAKMAMCAEKNALWGKFLEASGRKLSEAPPARYFAVENEGYGYETAMGRACWPSPDPIGEDGGCNLYIFANNNSIDWYDLFGLWVTATYNRTTGEATFIEAETGNSVYVPIEKITAPGEDRVNINSGNNGEKDDKKTRNDPKQNNYNESPLPAGRYLIAEGHPHNAANDPEDNWWYPLWRGGAKNQFGWSYQSEEKGKNLFPDGRGEFNIHQSISSNGCMSFNPYVGNVKKGNEKFKKLREILDKTKPMTFLKGKSPGNIKFIGYLNVE